MDSLAITELKRFNYLVGEINAAYHEAALKLGLSDSAMQILYAICNNGESCPLNDICKLSGTSKQTINSALRKLETDGILFLQEINGRRKNVCLTEKGKSLASETAGQLIEMENNIWNSWPKEDVAQYLTLTQHFLTDFQNHLKDLPENKQKKEQESEKTDRRPKEQERSKIT